MVNLLTFALCCLLKLAASSAGDSFLPNLWGNTSSTDAQTVIPSWKDGMVRCLAHCAALPSKTRVKLEGIAINYFQQENSQGSFAHTPYNLPADLDACLKKQRACNVYVDTFCARNQCQVQSSGDFLDWQRIAEPTEPPPPSTTVLEHAGSSFDAHFKCAANCASQAYLTVDIGDMTPKGDVSVASAKLKECGLVHLTGEVWPNGVVDEFRRGIAKIQADSRRHAALSARHLRANRHELYLPAAYVNVSEVGVPTLKGLLGSTVPQLLSEYIGDGISFDYVNVLEARGRVAGDQDLHSDVPFFHKTSISVHTALVDIVPEMGPTMFCPCTHSVTDWESKYPADEGEQVCRADNHSCSSQGLPFAEEVSLASLIKSAVKKFGSSSGRQCVGAVYTPEVVRRGTVTVYDGAILHAGLANNGENDRTVLNMNFASPPGYEVAHGYANGQSKHIKRVVAQWRKILNNPLSGTLQVEGK